MPPKPKAAQPSKKTVEKKKEKVIEDKTFGLKNKKGAKQQRFIQQVQNQVKNAGQPKKAPEVDKKAEKEKKLKEQKEMGLLFRPVATQKVEKGADPKSVVCAYFKQGLCTKGDRCKFSHDLTLERKAEKRSMYVDMRDEDETMENWDEEKLKEVVEKKHGEAEKKMPTTDIICKYFLDAVEKSKYGWFWQCPNGSSCIYRHALPPGFVLKKDKKKDEKKEELSLEDLIERERAALGTTLTKITLETFVAWKKRKLKEKKEAALREEEKKRNDYKAGRQVGISGREMFFFNPELAAADQYEDGDEVFDSYVQDDDDDDDAQEIQYREIKLDLLEMEAQEVDGSGTQAKEDRLKELTANGVAGSPDSTDGGDAGDNAAAVPINENLFMDDDLDDLDDLEEGLDDLSLDQ